MNALKIIKTLILSLIDGMPKPEQLSFFNGLLEVVLECLKALNGGVVKVEKPSNPITNPTRAEKTIQTITGQAPVSNMDGRVSMLTTDTVKAPVTVTTVTKKANGETKRQDPAPAPNGQYVAKKRGFGWMKNNGAPMVSYIYSVDGHKVSFTEFSNMVLNMAGAFGFNADSIAYIQRNGFTLPKKTIRENNYKPPTWERTVAGKRFNVTVNPKDLEKLSK